jgi:hypothetical protein
VLGSDELVAAIPMLLAVAIDYSLDEAGKLVIYEMQQAFDFSASSYSVLSQMSNFLAIAKISCGQSFY